MPTCTTTTERVRRPCRRQGGFSLLEVLVAFSLFAVVVGALLTALGLSLRATRVAEELSLAALWAQSKLDAVGVENKLSPGTTRGRFDDTYEYELTIRPWQPEDSAAAAEAAAGSLPVELFEVVLEVRWKGRSERFHTVRGRLKDGAGG